MRKSWNLFLLIAFVVGVAHCFSARAAGESAMFTFSVAKGWESPTYRLTIAGKQHPRVQFCGIHSTFFTGCRTDAISEQQWADFNALLDRLHFSELAAEYKSPETDAPIFVLCSQAPKKCVRIEAYTGLREDLRTLDSSLGRVLGTDRWVYGSVDAVRQLMTENRDLNARDGRAHESTLLIRALLYADKDVVAELLKDGINPNVRDKDGSTPLIRVIINGNSTSLRDKVEMLVGAGATVCARTPDGKTALELARWMESDGGRPNIKEFKDTDSFLVKNGGDCVETK
jgi:hypothetical protein